MLRELWRKSCGCWRYLQLADPAIIGGETMNLQSLTKKVVHICAHSGKAVNDTISMWLNLSLTTGQAVVAPSHGSTFSLSLSIC
jgi:hypothetical protein